MNLSLNQGSGGNAGAVELGGSAKAAPVNLEVGAVGFGPAWSDEPTVRELYDQACASIVRAECEADELRAEVAMLKQAMLLLAQERDTARNGETIEEWDHWRTAGERDEWRECAEKLHAAVCYLEPALLYDDPEGGFTAEREAVREFKRLKGDGGWANI